MTAIKICGNTSFEDALFAMQAGANMLGFIFYPPSPRSVDVDHALRIIERLRDVSIDAQEKLPMPKLVGVFVNMPADHVISTVYSLKLDYAQLHGDETPETLHLVRERLGGRVYKALKAQTTHVDDYALPDAPGLLLDANHPKLYGGSGVRADESIAFQVARKCKMILAGGLTPENVADAIQTIRPWGVDVASGVEKFAGVKDHAKVQAFIQAARQAQWHSQ
jgi:phosphoribosylanthranilate isomerase